MPAKGTIQSMVVKLQLSDEVRALAEARAAETGHATINEYMAALIEQDSEAEITQEVEREVWPAVQPSKQLQASGQT
jgi:hypothetical protein